jgi:hypothetical protein
MFGLGLLPWDFGIRSLFRRPLSSVLSLVGLTLAVRLDP